MKRYIRTTSLIDDYNVAQYLPKKYVSQIDEIHLEPDFDNRKGRTVNHYFVYFKDGSSLDAVGIELLKYKIKEKFSGGSV